MTAVTKNDTLRALAAEILASSGVDVQALTDAEFMDTRWRLAHQMSDQTGESYERCKRYMNTALGIAINGPTQRGGARPGAGLKRGQKINRKPAGKVTIIPGVSRGVRVVKDGEK